uniref:Uncharacterized protein n=1 Tax=Arundo donax TaxID=35708 RepID=A0A0A9AA33_ARUDO
MFAVKLCPAKVQKVGKS